MDNKRVVMKWKNFESGITLVALIITIIVLIILAAVSIIAVAKTNFIEVALNSSVNYAKKQNEEMNEMDYVDELMGDTVDRINGYGGTSEGESTPSIPEEGCVGYYADFEDDGEVDGIIYADLKVGGNGQWGDANGFYSIPKITNVKEYYISQTNYEGTFGTKDVISPLGSGEDRFYVMALKDIVDQTGNPNYSWYLRAYRHVPVGTTNFSFGEGKQNTDTMILKWNNEEYGTQSVSGTYGGIKDMWGYIQDEAEKGWFVPSKEEWAAFGGELRINETNYLNYKLMGSYWSSTQYSNTDAYTIILTKTYIKSFSLDRYSAGVRLSKTF